MTQPTPSPGWPLEWSPALENARSFQSWPAFFPTLSIPVYTTRLQCLEGASCTKTSRRHTVDKRSALPSGSIHSSKGDEEQWGRMSKQSEILNALGHSRTKGPSSGELEKTLWGKKKKDIGNRPWKKGFGPPPNSTKSTHENSRTSGFKSHSTVGKKSSPQHLPERGCFVNLSKHLRCLGFPGGASGKEPTSQCRRCKRHGFDPWVGKIPWRRAQQPTLTFLTGESLDRGTWQAMIHRVTKSQTQLICLLSKPTSPLLYSHRLYNLLFKQSLRFFFTLFPFVHLSKIWTSRWQSLTKLSFLWNDRKSHVSKKS